MTLRRVTRSVAVALAVLAGVWAGQALTARDADPTTREPNSVALTALDRARIEGRAALARARDARRQALVAGRLARQHRAAAAALTDARPLAGALETVADAYAAMGDAAAAGSRSRFGASRASVAAAEAGLARALARAPVTAAPARAGALPAIVVVVALVGSIVLGLATARRRKPPPELPPTRWMAVDPVGRWDSPVGLDERNSRPADSDPDPVLRNDGARRVLSPHA
ncbi:MAG TPA: hypothetical protein VFZ00_25865 [Solirubrobacter sp.]|nr:hypothetical protein [Solirubrobacter sp.]